MADDEKKQEKQENGKFKNDPQFKATAVADNAISTDVTQYCMGYGFGDGGGYGYIAVPKISCAVVSTQGLDEGTASIVSYDKTEKADAYIGQINMLTASSFCGLNGLLWGYHLCNNVAKDLKPMFTYPGPNYPDDEKLPGQGYVPVYPIGPLLDAGVRLFGRMDQDGSSQTDLRRFPPLPGSMVVCANKSVGLYGPGYVWAIVGVACAADREKDANLFIEDANAIKTVGTDDTHIQLNAESVRIELQNRLLNIAKSMVLCGQDQNVVYDKIFLGAKYMKVKKDQYGTALCCATYVQLPTDAIPLKRKGSALVAMKLSEWEKALKLEPLPPLSKEIGKQTKGIGVQPDGLGSRAMFEINVEKKIFKKKHDQ